MRVCFFVLCFVVHIFNLICAILLVLIARFCVFSQVHHSLKPFQQNKGGVTKSIWSIPFIFLIFSIVWKHTVAIEFHVDICLVSPQFSCSNSCQIWLWFKESNIYFRKIKFLLTEKWTNGDLVTPTPSALLIYVELPPQDVTLICPFLEVIITKCWYP